MTNTHILVFFFGNSEIHEQLRDPAVLYERQYRNNWSTLQQSGGGRRNNGYEKAEAQTYYGGWHLAAAVLGASKAVPGPVMVGTSGDCDEANAADNGQV